ncbi:acyl-CoA thioester hydrolase [Lutibacter agarilyticus]|uniref:Acyl-CoA thioester hydrolase n=1 Tax=Lutibacter agarilyticus TaxID=1109740 RepID=A0A238VGU3_9FLAO|nr:thioesterase family protein [Lutibacter agarilyticus]SNR33466.1 acyl-CoA thioester hydrolase [Lutibacter agarilyticus]
MNNVFTFKLSVSKNEIDYLNHVNNVIYIQWVLKAAELHWAKLSTEAINEKFVWVVFRHEIDYFLPGVLGDEITVNTWIGASSGAKSERFVEIKKGNKLLAKAKTTWCLLAVESMKAVRIPSEILILLK